MIWTLLFAAAAPAAPVATPETDTDPVIVSLIAGDGETQCLPDKSLCLELAGGDKGEARNLLVSSPASGDAEKISIAYRRAPTNDRSACGRSSFRSSAWAKAARGSRPNISSA